jgi:hypothetical protein
MPLDALDGHAEVPCQSVSQAGSIVIKLLLEDFPMIGVLKSSMSKDEAPMARGITEGIMTTWVCRHNWGVIGTGGAKERVKWLRNGDYTDIIQFSYCN